MPDRTEGIRRTLPADLSAEDEAAFWKALEQLRVDYAALADRRKAKPPKEELKRWQRNSKLLDQLGDGMSPPSPEALKSLKTKADEMRDPEALLAFLKTKAEADALALLKAKAADHIAMNERIVKTSRGHSGLPQLFLYGAVLDLWRVQLKKELRYSRSSEGPYGPLIDFVVAVVKPILGSKAPTVSGIAAIIDRERDRLDPAYRARKQAERKRGHANSSVEK